MTKSSRSLHASLFAVGVLLSLTFTGAAQSGRRVVKTPPPPPPIATEPTAVPKPSPAKLAPLMTLIVGMDQTDSFSRIPLSAFSGVLQTCVDRLNSASVKAIQQGGSMGRGEAVQKAKSEKEAHIVWLQVALDTLSASQGSNPDIQDAFIEYVVLAPGTAKSVASGRTYPYKYRSRSVIPTTRTGGLYGDYRYNEAAREAAERILSALKLPSRPVPGK